MKKQFQNLTIELISFYCEDVITTSAVLGNNELPFMPIDTDEFLF